MDFFSWVAANPFILSIALGVVGIILVVILLIFVSAFIQGRSISFWPPQIGPKGAKSTAIKPPGSTSSKLSKYVNPRVGLLGSTTFEIEKDKNKAIALERFYRCFWQEMERTPIGINTCGAEPLRSIILQSYCEKLPTASREQINAIHDKVRWYWYPNVSDTYRFEYGYRFTPPIFNSVETANMIERTIREVNGSDLIVALTGRTGTREQLERLIKYNALHSHKINLNQKPIILLAWFGGSVSEFINDHYAELGNYLKLYEELNPTVELPDWDIDDNSEKLARQLINTIQRLLSSRKLV